MKSFPNSLVSALLLAFAGLAPGQEKPVEPPKKEEPKEEKKKDEKKDDSAETKHQISLDGQALTYTATASTITLTKAYGEPRAKIFHVSYVRTGAEDSAKRPVCFCFNGGPGSSAVWLHLGAFGPRRVVLPEGGTTAPKPPYALADNEYTLLRDTDLVFVDPVSTGLSMAEKGEDPKQFFGFNEDVESVGDFVRLWITRHNRWGSPKFLMGESYGAIRVSGLAASLQDRFGMYLNGIIIVSGLLDFKTLSPDAQNDVPFIGWLPGYAACAWYHKKLAPELLGGDFQGLWTRVREFARGAYANALLLGASLPPADRERIAAELSTLTGLPKDFILRQNLRIDPGAFRQKLLESEDKVIGRFDGRVAGVSGDPSYNVVFGAFATTMNSYLRDKDGLNYQTDKPYEILNGGVNPWNYGRANRYFDVCQQLGNAIAGNPSLQVFIGCGYHDLATPAEGIEGSVRHIELPQELRGNFHWGFYDGGHMMYTNLPSLKKLSADVSAFMKQALK